LVRDLWPDGLGQVVGDDRQLEDLEPWQVFPHSMEDLFRWMYITRRSMVFDRTRPFEVLHAPMANSNTKYSVVMRMQGFVKKMNLSTYGNWNGLEKGAPGAIQMLILESGGHDEPFHAQIDALERVRSLVFRQLTGHDPADRLPRDKIYFQRRVFQKVSVCAICPSTLLSNRQASEEAEVAIDITDHRYIDAQEIAKHWVARPPLPIGAPLDTGVCKKLHHLVLSPGDFVDVAVSVDIAYFRNGARGTPRVQFSLEHVLLLASADDVQTVRTERTQVPHVTDDC
ncbi:hypothetical protein OBBRIDRAFT_732177, partial [Obba rivulosa]